MTLLDAASAERELPRMGGKGAGLWALSRLRASTGAEVPDFFVVPTDVFTSCAAPLLEDARRAVQHARARDRAALERASASLVARARALALPDGLADALADRAATLAVDSGGAVAVRSSANVEDSATRSFAGQLSTEVGVAAGEVAQAVRRCWSSLYAPGCLAYIAEAGLAIDDIAVAVVVQRLVRARVAGVAFSARPDGALDEAVVVACLGLGETVVQGRPDVDSWVFERAGSTWRATIGDKRRRIVLDERGGERAEEVPVAERVAPSLDDGERARVLALVDAAAAARGRAMDVEWAIDERGVLNALQARPITTLPAGGACFFDRANVVESFPGITGPLTFSQARESYQHVFRNTLRRLGVPHQTLLDEDATFRSLIGYVQGRVYYNTASWVRVLSLIPGAEPYLKAWEQMIGVSSKAREGTSARAAGVLGTVRTALRFLWHIVWLDVEHRAFVRRFDRAHAQVMAADLAKLDAHALIELYRGMNASLLDGWEVTFLNDGVAFLFTAIAKAQLAKTGAGPEVLPGLLAADGELESTRPLTALRALAAELPPALATKLAAVVEGGAFPPRADDDGERAALSRLDDWLRQFGDRRAEELKLESPSFREEPRPLVRLLLAARDHDVAALGARSGARRSDAERQARLAFAGHPLRRLVAAASLALARRSVRWREASRLRRTRGFGGIRRLFVELGRRLAADRVIAAADDVFFLETDEVLQAIKGCAPPDDPAALVEARRARLAAWAAERPRERFATRGIVAAHPIPARPAPSAASDGELRGIACASGVARGRALVVRDPRSAPDTAGRVLIAETTDPGWVFLLAPAAALVAEKGSLLSHTAIIGRELGVPTVVNVANATELIPDGALVEVDGSSGIVRILAEPREAREVA
ncbi:MAG: hypothetical protein A2138_11005 [Deltaproteobacteria bacterium RBG_16_71_12]|nr:MAG: hypothetical protein A2138_11005 [Deltaproteobacteria bacterium RBG_16_71_12]